MGYRNHIALLSIEKYNNIKDKKYNDLKKEFGDDGRVGVYDIADCIYELGKYWEHDFLNQHKVNIFSDQKTNELFNDEGELFIIGRAGLLSIISDYHKKIDKIYKELLDPSADVSTLASHIKSMASEWASNRLGLAPYNLESESKRIINSWKYEYTIFELVNIYKYVDEKNQLICLLGY